LESATTRARSKSLPHRDNHAGVISARRSSDCLIELKRL
jgi:hypothetical protein